MVTKRAKNEPLIFYCKKCDYSCDKKTNWLRHCKSIKHNGDKMVTQKEPPNTSLEHRCICGKIYKYRQGLHRHKKACGIFHEDLLDENKELRTTINTLIDQNGKVLEELSEQNKIMKELVPKVGNNNNNSFNLQIFLNETCKEAINMKDFIKSLTVGLNELEYTRENGLVKGISSVMVNGLKQIEINKRPIHCTDVKRDTIYVKDEDAWKKNDKKNIKDSIDNLTQKHIKAIHEWEKKNPNWKGNELLETEYMNLVQKVMESVDDSGEKKIMKNISKEVQIDKNIKI